MTARLPDRAPRRWRRAALAAVATACVSPRTEVVVSIQTDLATGPGQALQSLAIAVRRSGPSGELRLQNHVVLGTESAAWTLPSTIGLLPRDGDTSGAVWVEVAGCPTRASCDDATATVTQRAVVSYVRGETLSIDLLLASRCVGVRCPSDQTCSAMTGLCVTAARQSELRAFSPDAGAVTSVDAQPEVGIDAPTDVVVDASSDGVVDASSAPAQRSCAGASVPGCGVVSLAGGSFSMGFATACADEVSPGEGCALRASPVSPPVRVDPFVLDAYEVTVARFRRFWTERARDGGASLRASPVAYPGGHSVAWPATASAGPSVMGGCAWSTAAGAVEDHPIDCLTYWLAMEFCVWDGGRLPTEAEWEYAARWRAVPAEGLAAGRWYPWGDAPPSTDCDRARWNASLTTRCARWGSTAAPVGAFAAAGGLFDLAGNVSEFTADRYTPFQSGCWTTGGDNPLCAQTFGAEEPSNERAVTRGAGWNAYNTAWLRGASRRQVPLDSASLGVGLRCARSR